MVSAPIAKSLLFNFIDEAVILAGTNLATEDWIKQTMAEFLELDIACLVHKQDNEPAFRAFFDRKMNELLNKPGPIGLMSYRIL